MAALITIGVMGAGLAAYGELASHAAQREKERELLFVGNQFRQAIGAYYERSPGGAKRLPRTLEELLADKRYPMPRRYLRRLYADPITGKREWGFIQGPDGGIMGVYSLSEARPVKTGGATSQGIRVESGLNGGEDLIVNPPADLKDGAKVRRKQG